jgi:hypothetical protein
VSFVVKKSLTTKAYIHPSTKNVNLNKITFSYTEFHREDTEGHGVKKPDLCGSQ